MHNRTDRTYIEDVKDPKEVLLPSHNFYLIVLRVENSGGDIPFALLDDLLLDLCHGSMVG